MANNENFIPEIGATNNIPSFDEVEKKVKEMIFRYAAIEEENDEKTKNKIKEKAKERYEHSIRVVEKAVEYAKHYRLEKDEIEKVKLVAIAHDIAKMIPKDKRIEEAEKLGIKLDDYEKENTSLIHAKIGAKICETEFGFTQDMCNAISYHTTGREKMSLLEKIIYLADATERNRNDSAENTELVKNNIDEAMFKIVSQSIEERKNENKDAHPDSIACRDFSKKQIQNIKD